MTRYLKPLAVFATVGMYLVVVAGALVSATGSGDGCGRSWPLCGSPVWTVEAVIEFSHRVVSGLAALAVVVFVPVALRALPGRRDARWLAYLGVGFLFLQAGLGAWLVLWGQPDAVLALHFGISLVSFAAVALLALLVFREAGAGAGAPPGGGRLTSAAGEEPASPSPRLRRWIWMTLALSYVIVYTGAYVRHTQSSLACPGWPLCGVPVTGAAAIQMAHRAGAGLLVLAIMAVTWLAFRERQARPDLFRGSLAALVLVGLQAVSGGLVVLTRLSLVSTLSHSSIVTLLFAVLAYLCLQVAGDTVGEPGRRLPAAARGPVATGNTARAAARS
ncbi:MAG TPA: COX15/CtaA family protein [Thermaerobacter sp.]